MWSSQRLGTVLFVLGHLFHSLLVSFRRCVCMLQSQGGTYQIVTTFRQPAFVEYLLYDCVWIWFILCFSKRECVSHNGFSRMYHVNLALKDDFIAKSVWQNHVWNLVFFFVFFSFCFLLSINLTLMLYLQNVFFLKFQSRTLTLDPHLCQKRLMRPVSCLNPWVQPVLTATQVS